MFLLTIFKEDTANIFFQLTDISTTSDNMFITC